MTLYDQLRIARMVGFRDGLVRSNKAVADESSAEEEYATQRIIDTLLQHHSTSELRRTLKLLDPEGTDATVQAMLELLQ